MFSSPSTGDVSIFENADLFTLPDSTYVAVQANSEQCAGRSVNTIAASHTAPVDRGKKRREMHLDRRPSQVDVLEHVMSGVCSDDVRATADNRAPRSKASLHPLSEEMLLALAC